MLRLITFALSFSLLIACGDDDSGADTSPPSDGGTDATDAGDTSVPEDTSPECTPTGEIIGGLGEHTAVFDEMNNRLVVYGGNTVAPVMCVPAYELTSDMWAFDLTCEQWSRLTPNGTGPGVRTRHHFVVDGARQRAIAFGGRDRTGAPYTNYADVFAFDFATDTWSEIVTTGTGPSPRSNGAVAIAGDRLLVFGGDVATSGFELTGVGDFFSLDLTTNEWTEITAEGAPSPRLYPGGVVVGDDFVVFGGTPSFSGPYRNDLYAFDVTTDTWRALAGGGPDSPPTRFGGELYADDANGLVYLTGGHDSTSLGNINDVWAFDIAAGTWRQTVDADVQNAEPFGRCDFPANFTTPNMDAPDRRHYFGHTQSATMGYVVGGKTDCGNINDIWAIDFATGLYVPVGPAATTGEACNRTGSTTCSSLCF